MFLPEFEDALHQQLFRVDTRDEVCVCLEIVLLFEDAFQTYCFGGNTQIVIAPIQQ